MKTVPFLLCLLAGGLIMAGSVQAKATKNDGCHKVKSTGVGQDLGGGNTMATIKGGKLKGTTTGHFDMVGGTPPVFLISGAVTFTTKHGTLTVTPSGTFDVASGHFNATGPITGGTGKWAGTTGSLTLDGIENLTTGAFTETITGMTCGAEDDEDD